MFIIVRNNEIDFHAIQLEIAANSEKALSDLYAVFSRRLTIFAKSLVHSKEIAEEVVEDVFVKLWANRKDIGMIDNLAVYLYVSVKNRSLNKLSERAKELITGAYDELDPEVEAIKENPHTILVTSEMLEKMNRAIEKLPPRCKIIFKLVREDGLRYKEVAEILNLSINTIDAQMAIAVKRISGAIGIQHLREKKNRADHQKKV